MRTQLLGATLVWLLCRITPQVSGQVPEQEITFPLEVSALKAVRRELKDPLGRLDNWEKNDPCASKWTGVICKPNLDDGYNHVQELRLLNMNLSGKLSPQLGQFSQMTILNFMWNDISGSIPKEIGNMSSLNLLLLSGNLLSGPLPDELGNLPNITKFQLDINFLSGPIPKSFGNLSSVQHFHMNNNSFSGQIPTELARLPKLVHFLLDNNNFTGNLPEELSLMPSIKIFQVNNNNFSGTSIPESYTNMSKLLKLTLRHCNLQGNVPDFSSIPGLRYLDLSSNQLSGTIPTNKLSENITTIDLSKNLLTGPIPSNFSVLPLLQRLSLQRNFLNGTIPSTFWQNIMFESDTVLNLNFRNNMISNISGSLYPPPNVTIELQGNPICEQANELDIVQFCGPEGEEEGEEDSTEYSGRNSTTAPPNDCNTLSCPASQNFEYVRGSPESCFCAAPIGVGMRLRSPSFSDFRPFIGAFETYIYSNLGMESYQVTIDSFVWQEGPRVRLFIKAFPHVGVGSDTFNDTEVQRIVQFFARFSFPSNDAFGPYDLLNFTLLGPYKNVIVEHLGSGMSKALLIGIVLGAIACGLTIILALVFIYTRINRRREAKVETRQPKKTSCKIEGVKGFSFSELESATCSFEITAQIGQGGYGKVYKGILNDGTVVAVKRAQQGSLQGEREFFTEIELLSRVHHRNLVSLIGYCDEEDEQMLVYEFMANGSLHSLLSARFRISLGFGMRVQIALDAAKGILYLHKDADPPIIHRDIKANNILLDSKFTAKVSDFGISRLAPVSDDIDVTAHVSTVVKGTPGYVDPEYFLTRKLTEKSDVYSLGIVFLELLTAKPPISHGRNIVREVQSACESGNMVAMIDRDMGSYDPDCAGKFLRLALRCCREETKARPTMHEVVRELEILSSIVPRLPETKSPGLYAAYSGGAPSEPSQVYSGGNTYVGSDLVSGVFPEIKPR